MSIEPGTVYTELVATVPNRITWIMPGALSSDLVAGLVFGLYTLLGEIWQLHYTKEPNVEAQVLLGHADGIIVINNATVNQALQHYRNVYKGITWHDEPLEFPWYANRTKEEQSRDLEQAGLIPPLPEGKLGWFIYNFYDDFYPLCEFVSVEFIQGFMSMCNAFGVNYKRYTLGLPFKFGLTDARPTFYRII